MGSLSASTKKKSASSCRGQAKIDLVHRVRNLVLINRGKSCNYNKGRKVCIYSGKNRLLCSRITQSFNKQAIIRLPKSKIRKMRRGFHVHLAPVRKSSGEEDFFKIESSVVEQIEEAEDDARDDLSFGGSFTEQLAWGRNEEGTFLSSGLSTLHLDLSWKFNSKFSGKLEPFFQYDAVYNIDGREKYDPALLNRYEFRQDIREGYLSLDMFSWLSLKVGRQISVWGESEFNQITDLVNPRNYLESAIGDVQDARLGVLASKIDLSIGSTNTSLIVNHEKRANLRDGKDTAFDPYAPIRKFAEVNDENIVQPAGDVEYLARFLVDFQSGQLTLMAADLYQDDPHLILDEITPVDGVSKASFVPAYHRYRAYGGSANLVISKVILKGEAAYYKGRYLPRRDVAQQLAIGDFKSTYVESDSVRSMAGFEYSPIQDWDIIFEVLLEEQLDYDPSLLAFEKQYQYDLYQKYQFSNSLSSKLWITNLDGVDNWVLKGELEKKLFTHLQVGTGFFLLENFEEESTTYEYRGNDRLYAWVKVPF